MPTINVNTGSEEVTVVPTVENIVIYSGQQGPRGPQGPPGTRQNISGSVPTYADLPVNPPNGSVWITLDTEHSWLWSNAKWNDLGSSSIGPQGPTGPAGAPGAPGAPGPTGPPPLSHFNWSDFPGLPAPGEYVSIPFYEDVFWAHVGCWSYIVDENGVAVGGDWQVNAVNGNVITFLRIS